MQRVFIAPFPSRRATGSALEESSTSLDPIAGTGGHLARHAADSANGAHGLDLRIPDHSIENHGVQFEIIGEIEHVETIAVGAGVRVRALLNKVHGKGRWRKRKGFARVRLPGGTVRRVELHWYEAHGIGRRDFKIKAYADQP